MFATLLLIAFTTPADAPPELPAEAKKELAKLEGKWKVTRMAAKGQDITLGPNDPELIAEIKDGKWFFGSREKAHVSAIDPKTDPKCIDFKSVEQGRGGAVDEAIFKLDGDTFTIALYQGKGKQRPTTFDAPKDNDTILVVLKRVKD